MRNIFFKVLGFVKRRWLLTSIVVIAVILIVLLFSKGNGAPLSVAVARGPVVSLVNVTGQARPPQSLDLAFLQGGRIERIYSSVGDKVSSGQILVRLTNADIAAQVAQSEADVKNQQAKLDALLRGTRPEDLSAKAAELQKAKSDLSSYYTEAINVLNDAYTKIDDTLHTQLDSFFTNDDETNPQLTFSSSDLQGAINVTWYRVLARDVFNKLGSEISVLQANPTADATSKELKNAQTYLTTVRTLLDALMNVLNNAGNLSGTTVSTYKTYMSNARSEINTASTNITSQQQLIDGQEATVAQVQSQYDLLKAGSTKEDIDSQRAQLEQAQASARYQEALYEKTLIRAPFSGTVTRLPFREGDTVTISDTVVSLVGTGKMQIEGSIAETDISRVKIGESAQVTLDAYGPDVTFGAKVIKIDLSATALEGVATYKTTLEFNQNDERILPGLTANVDILSDKRDNVLYIPTRDILEEGDKQYANVLIDAKSKQTKRVEITAGLRGSDGKTEIISGLNEGDLVVAE